MRCLVTGADGFVGWNLCRYLFWRGHDVVGITPNRDHPRRVDSVWRALRMERGDILDQQFLGRVMTSVEPEWVFHLAAQPIVRAAERDLAQTLRTNIDGTLNVITAASAAGAQAIVCATSDKAYGDHGGKHYTEDMALEPSGPYEVSKACADHVALLMGRHGHHVRVIRAANTFGPGDYKFSRLIPACIRAGLCNKPANIYGSAVSAQREWVDVESVCSAYLHVAEGGEDGHAYNCGSEWVCSPAHVARRIAERLGAPEPVVTGDAGFEEIEAQCLNSAKLRRLGWDTVPETFYDAIDTTIADYSEEFDRCAF